jgi:hypothetical protein
MSLWARSDLASVTVSAAHGGCGEVHIRPAPGGVPDPIWRLDCDVCADHLRHDDHWSVTVSEIPETWDEAKSREDFDKRGAKDKDAILTLALARLAGIDSAELPESLTRMISGAPLHVPVQGKVECPSGHAQPPGQKFCGECGADMRAPAAKPALESAQRPAGTSSRVPPAEAGPRSRRLRDARLDELQALARLKGVDADGKRPDLITRLAVAGVTSADLQRLPVSA